MQNENFALFSLNAFTRAPLPARLLWPLSMAKFKHNKETYTYIYLYILNMYTISAVNLQFKCRRGLLSYYLRATYMYHVSFSSVTWGILIISTSARTTVFGGHCVGQQWHFDRHSTHIHRKHFDIDSWTGQQHLRHLVRPVRWWQISKTHYSHFWRKCETETDRAPWKRAPNDH